MILQNSFNVENSYFADNLSFPFSEDNYSFENDDLFKDLNSSNSEKKSNSIKFKVLKNKRKYKPDNIIKKIKSAAHRKLISNINEKLKSLGLKYTFKKLPQHFITDITKKTNYEAIELTYRELIEFTYNNLINDHNYCQKEYYKKLVKTGINNYYKNQKILAFLDCNPEMNKKSGLEEIMNTKYIDLLREYFISKEFELIDLELSQGKDKDYYYLYKHFSKNYFDFFDIYKSKETNTKIEAKNKNGNEIFGNIYKENINDDTQNPNCNEIIKNNNFPILVVEENDLFGNYNSSFEENLMDENSLILDERNMNQRSW